MSHAFVSYMKRKNVVETINGMDAFFQHQRWLSVGNRYLKTPAQRVKSDFSTTKGSLLKNDLAQYVAASSFLHYSDAWRYLGSALTQLSRGNVSVCIHLAYYAELRASMALLASEGFGAFNQQHVYIDGKDSVRSATKGATHQIAWEVLKAWSDCRKSGDIFADIVKPGGQSLNEWYRGFPKTGSIHYTAKQWLLEWGVDLDVAAKDKDMRNLASYNPSAINELGSLSGRSVIDTFEFVWTALEPSEGNPFELIDAHILRLANESLFKARTGNTSKKAPAKYAEACDKLVEQQAFSDVGKDLWKAFLKRERDPDDLEIFSFASEKDQTKKIKYCQGVVARAILMLRVTGGSVMNLAENSIHDINTWNFWYRSIAINAGVMASSEQFEPSIDWWKDISDALEDMIEMRDEMKSNTLDDSVRSILTRSPGNVMELSTAEKAAIWSFCL